MPKRVAEMQPYEWEAERVRLGLSFEDLAEPCEVLPDTIRGWVTGVQVRNRLAFKCFLATLQAASDAAEVSA